jgi:phospholipase A1
MKRFLAAAVALALIAVPLAAQSKASESEYSMPGFTNYKPSYIIMGWGSMDESSRLQSNDLVLVNFSMKYDFFHKLRLGIYLGYTQTMFWGLFEDSGPFKEINFKPELFFRFESGYNFLGDAVVPGLDYFQAGWEHRSNGKDGTASRGWDRAYAQVQGGFGKTVHVAANVKWFEYINIPIDTDGDGDVDNKFLSLSDNPLIRDFTSNFEFQLLADLDIPVFPLKIVLSAGPGGGAYGFDFLMGWQQLDVYFMRFAGNLRPYLQIWNGYGQSIENYDQESFNAHAGIAIEM